MRILLIGEYSNLHHTLACGLRELGHEVMVISNGDFWKDYPRDIDVSRTPGRLGGLRLMYRLRRLLPQLRGYDVVQLINPMFFELKADRLFYFYDYLRKHNKKVFLGAFGMDYYWVHTCMHEKPLRYSDFNIGETLRTDAEAIKHQHDWLGTAKERLNRQIAVDCDGIITCLYEYDACYRLHFPEKTTFIPLPIQLPATPIIPNTPKSTVSVFIGINRERSAYKGTDIMLQAVQAIQKQYPQQLKLQIAESLPFTEYSRMMEQSDAILDQLYSYTPSMNSLLAMSKGIICIGGGEPENYEIIDEHVLRPIINVQPNYESVCNALEQLVSDPELIPELKRQSIAYVAKHHDYHKIAQRYLDVWNKK